MVACTLIKSFTLSHSCPCAKAETGSHTDYLILGSMETIKVCFEQLRCLERYGGGRHEFVPHVSRGMLKPLRQCCKYPKLVEVTVLMF